MIKEQDYLNALEIVKNYNFQNKKKVGRKSNDKISIQQKKEFLELLFKKEKSVSYAKIVMAIYLHYSTGVNSSKKILTEMKNENLIIQNGKRGNYEIPTNIPQQPPL